MRLNAGGREALLSYATNVHPAETLAEVWEALRTHAVPLKAAASPDGPLGVGLYLSAAAAEPLAARPESAEGFREFLAAAGLEVVTLNAFPFETFHARRVKETVYRPDWTTPRRLAYTLAAGRALAALLPEGGTGTVSTLPGSWKAWEADEERMAANLLEAAEGFRRIGEETGRTLILCLEPEPLCTLETTEETVAFFRRHLSGVRRHLGVCLDTGHLAVEFEDLRASVRRFRAEGIRVAKVQMSSALAVREPGRNPGAVRRLMDFDEERFLHQVTARTPAGILRLADLGLLADAPPAWRDASEWRCHFHVPVDREAFPPLQTTQGELAAVLPDLLALPERPHFEVETYTWGVLPEAERPTDRDGLVQGLARELAWARAALTGRLF